MAQSHQTPNDSGLSAHPRDSWMNTWLPTLFGSTPSRLLKPPPPPKPKRLDYIYGLNMETFSGHTTTYTEPEDCKLTESKTSGDSHTIQNSRSKSWHSSQTSTVAMRRRRLGEAKDKYKNQDGGQYKNKTASGHHDTTIDTILLTRTSNWELQKSTLQYTKKSRNINKLRARNKALEGRQQRLRRRAGSTVKSQTKRNKKPKAVTNITVYEPKNSSVGGNQNKTQWPKRIAKAWKVSLYVMGIATVLALCAGIAILICKFRQDLPT